MTAAVTLVVTAAGCSVTASPKPEIPSVAREFGVVMSPSHAGTWTAKVGAGAHLPMSFEAWSRNRTYEDRFAQTRKAGMRSYMVTWEPWKPAGRGLAITAQAAVQPGYSNADVAAGKHDAYLHRWAKSVRESGLRTVYIRYAHEMNGDWFPWYHDPAGYVKAWRHIVDVFRADKATNARFVWSVNPSLYQDDARWATAARPYWPGGNYVDYIGSTMISFGGNRCEKVPCGYRNKDYPVALFAQRIALARRTFGRDVVITEANTDSDGRLKWLRDLQKFLAASPWVRVAVLSQAPSRAAAAGIGSGKLDWNVENDPEASRIVRDIIATMAGGKR